MLVNQIDVDKAVYETLKVMKSEVGKEDQFSKYAPIYMGPTGNVIDAVKLYTKENKHIESALVMGSQGSFAYELALNGVKKIDCFDKNILQYMFFALYNAAISIVDFKEFISNFTTRKNGYTQRLDSLLGDWLFFDVLDMMGGIEAEYWSKLLKKEKRTSLIASNLFRTYYPLTFEYLKQFSSVYRMDKYEELQLQMNHVQINYHICELDELHKEFEGKQYELVMLGNILQYYKSFPGLDNVSAVHRFVRDKLSLLLKEKGNIQLCYGFEIATDAIKQLLGSEEMAVNSVVNLIKQRGIDKDKKEGFMANIIKKYGLDEESPYSIDFIRAVEEMDGHMDSKNSILTYKHK